MIPKGNQRAGGQQLATHLLNAYDNDRVEVAEVRGSVAQDLHGAFAEWYAVAKATQCSKYLYSLSINPDHAQGPYTRAHYDDFIRRTESKLGLAGQPRAVVFHVKYGREHCHVVWSRIDIDKMKAVQLSHDRQKLRAVAQEYAKEHGLTLPLGMRKDRGLERFNEHAKGENLAEKQQEERSGISKQQRREAITAAWRQTKTGKDFAAALEKQGYILARGDSRSYVVVDRAGEVHALARQIEGAKTKDIKARLAGYALEKIPDVETAQQRAGEWRDERRRENAKDARTLGEIRKERRAVLEDRQRERRAALEEKKQALAAQHAKEREALKALQAAETKGVLDRRLAGQSRGIVAFLARITGIRAFVEMRQRKQDEKRSEAHREQTAALKRRHAREMEDFSHRERGLTSLEKRERRSLGTAFRREAFRTIAAPARDRQPAQQLTAAQAARVQDFRQTAAQMAKAQEPSRAATRDSRGLGADFRDAASGKRPQTPPPAPARRQGDVSPAFNQEAIARESARGTRQEAIARASARGTKQEPPPRDSVNEKPKPVKPLPADLAEIARRRGLAAKFSEAATPPPAKGREERAKEKTQEFAENAKDTAALPSDLAEITRRRAAKTRKDQEKKPPDPSKDRDRGL